MPKILAIIVCYHPEPNIVDNVDALSKQVTHIVIVDNETTTSSQQLLGSLNSTTITVIPNVANKGVAEGFNQGLRWGLSEGFDFFLLMDQDSCVQPQMVSQLYEVSSERLSQKKLALVGPRHEDFNRKLNKEMGINVESVSLLISSGSFISKELIERVGLYDERLFIDHVDHDFSLRVRQRGGECLKVNNALLLHRFGEAKVKTFLGKTFFMQEYSPFRRYHMMRNRLVLYKRYGMFKGQWFWLDLRSAITDLAKLILFETNKTPKLKAVLRGLKDGLLWQD